MTASIRPHAYFPCLSNLIAQFDGLTHDKNCDLPYFVKHLVTWDAHGEKKKLSANESSLTFTAKGAGVTDNVKAEFELRAYTALVKPEERLHYNTSRLTVVVRENDWAETILTFRRSREAFGAVTARISVRGNGWEFPVLGYPHVLQLDGLKKQMSGFIHSGFTKYPGKHLLDGHTGGAIFVAFIILQFAADWHNGVLSYLPSLDDAAKELAKQMSETHWGD